jgi:hypothetical protein
MLSRLANPVIELPNQAFARTLEKVALRVCRIHDFDPAPIGLIFHELLKLRVSFGFVNSREIPSLRLDLQIDSPLRILLELFDEKAGIARRIVAVNPAVITVDEPGSLALEAIAARSREIKEIRSVPQRGRIVSWILISLSNVSRAPSPKEFRGSRP